ncbi:hypothetical protein F511_33977 [Dorcoceras hygrometricum]|uniref:Uncharacterized protein n=1 Tax=Dorcoceras hygrometricum TaxID=472368 RepID=A0A2Z7AVT3_9LAMI|nr:hypothetical protein F511_33977 [Dorcoceras hygrometricum]
MSNGASISVVEVFQLLVSIQLLDISDVEAFSRYNQMLQCIQQLGIYFRSKCIQQLGIYFSSEYFQTLATVAFDSVVTIYELFRLWIT